MELRQLRYFVKVCELRSMGRAAIELGVVTSALSQQISRLESELSTRLLQRASTGVTPTDAGVAFLQQAQLTLRHADEAVRAAQQARLSGHVSVGLAPTTAAVLGLPLMMSMRERYPDIRLHLVESLSGNLGSMLQGRQLDLAVLFETATTRRWSIEPLLDEKLFLIMAKGMVVPTTSGMTKATKTKAGVVTTASTKAAPFNAAPSTAAASTAIRSTAVPSMALLPSAMPPIGSRVRISQLAGVPLIMPSEGHGLRASLTAAFARAGVEPLIVAEIDGLALLMDAVRAGLGATIQPGAAVARQLLDDVVTSQISDAHVGRRNLLVSLSDDELSPAALATRVVIADVARTLVRERRWVGARLHKN